MTQQNARLEPASDLAVAQPEWAILEQQAGQIWFNKALEAMDLGLHSIIVARIAQQESANAYAAARAWMGFDESGI